jgi:UDP-glucose 4-epimerase
VKTKNKTKYVLITGGAGYLGSHLARELLQKGYFVRLLDNNFSKYAQQLVKQYPARCNFWLGDITSRSDVERSLNEVGQVIHLAFVQSLSDKSAAEKKRINIGGTINLLNAMVRLGIGRIIFSSSIEVYGTRPPFSCTEDLPVDELDYQRRHRAPVGWYGEHKLAVEKIIQRYYERYRVQGLETIILRLPTIGGCGFYNHKSLLGLIDRIISGQTVYLIRDIADCTRADLVGVNDAVQAFELCLGSAAAVGQIFNVSGAQTATHYQLVSKVIAATRSPAKIFWVNQRLSRWALQAMRWLKLSDLPDYQLDYLFHDNHYSIDKAVRMLGYRPKKSAVEAAIDLAKGYKRDYEYIKKRSLNY